MRRPPDVIESSGPWPLLLMIVVAKPVDKIADADLDGRHRSVADILMSSQTSANVSATSPGCIGSMIFSTFLPKILEHLDVAQQIDGPIAADVV